MNRIDVRAQEPSRKDADNEDYEYCEVPERVIKVMTNTDSDHEYENP